MNQRKLPGGETVIQGPHGVLIPPKLDPGNAAQRRLQAVWDRCFMMFLLGPAGTGKSFAPVTLAVRDLMMGRARKIMLTRPIVPIRGSRAIGYYKGDMMQKLGPWLEPMLDPIEAHGLPRAIIEQWVMDGRLEMVDLQTVRGRTVRNATMLVDESQNLHWNEIVCLTTRVADNGRLVFMGDVSQSDLDDIPPIVHAMEELRRIKGITSISFDGQRNMRNKRMESIIRALERAGEYI